MNELILSEDSTIEIKDGKVVIKKSKSKIEIDKDGNIKLENNNQKSAPEKTDAD